MPRLHHRTVIPFSAEQSRAGTVAASLFLSDFFVTIFDRLLPHQHPQSNMTTTVFRCICLFF